MGFSNDMLPRDYLLLKSFSPRRAHERYPNVRKLTLGGLFISHSGIDHNRIRDEIIFPVVYKRLPGEGYFLHNRHSGGSKDYKGLVQAALHWCDKFMVVISSSSIAHEWVLAEVEWALERSRPILVVSFDGHDWKELISTFRPPLNLVSNHFVQCFDFSNDLKQAQKQLAVALDKLLERFPRSFDPPS